MDIYVYIHIHIGPVDHSKYLSIHLCVCIRIHIGPVDNAALALFAPRMSLQQGLLRTVTIYLYIYLWKLCIYTYTYRAGRPLKISIDGSLCIYSYTYRAGRQRNSRPICTTDVSPAGSYTNGDHLFPYLWIFMYIFIYV